MVPVQKACLVVIDGWGVSKEDGSTDGDAIKLANTPIMDGLMNEFGCLPLEAHGEAVGLPAGLMGNSEVGHLNIGAGRIVYQDILRINKLLESPQMQSDAYDEMVKLVKQRQARLHLIGLVSDGGVHSHQEHLFSLLDHLQRDGVKHVSVHAITDGRDTAPKCCLPFLSELTSHLVDDYKLVTIVGRYYAMDRDKRWERTKIAFDAMTGQAKLPEQESLSAAISSHYEAGETDEFLSPMVFAPECLVQDDDVLLFFNFRSDRMRQIVQAFGSEKLDIVLPFESNLPRNLAIVTMTKYREDFTFPLLSPPQKMDDVLAEWLSKQGIAQMHVAETEKFSHVTVFFNGGREAPFPLEDRILVPSPKVATYDLKPEMSSVEVADAVIESLETGKYPFVMCNFAPPDMVGHTGHLPEAINAVEATDTAIGRVYEACKGHGYTLIVTADHGNAEKMIETSTGAPHKAHTCAPVPLIITKPVTFTSGISAALCDVAPTVLALMGIGKPDSMSGSSVIDQ